MTNVPNLGQITYLPGLGNHLLLKFARFLYLSSANNQKKVTSDYNRASYDAIWLNYGIIGIILLKSF